MIDNEEEVAKKDIKPDGQGKPKCDAKTNEGASEVVVVAPKTILGAPSPSPSTPTPSPSLKMCPCVPLFCS